MGEQFIYELRDIEINDYTPAVGDVVCIYQNSEEIAYGRIIEDRGDPESVVRVIVLETARGTVNFMLPFLINHTTMEIMP